MKETDEGYPYSKNVLISPESYEKLKKIFNKDGEDTDDDT